MYAHPSVKVVPVLASLVLGLSLYVILFSSNNLPIATVTVAKNASSYTTAWESKIGQDAKADAKKLSPIDQCKSPSQCQIKKTACPIVLSIEHHVSSNGLISTLPASNLNVSMKNLFCNPSRQDSTRLTLLAPSNNSVTHALCHRAFSKRLVSFVSEEPIVLLPGYGGYWPGRHHNNEWPDYCTGLLINQSVCFWEGAPQKFAVHETDISLWNLSNPVHVKTAIVSGGFFDNFWHSALILNDWCTYRKKTDWYFLIQPQTLTPKSYVTEWMQALGIDPGRIIVHDRPVVAQNVYGTPHVTGVDWSCLNAVLKPAPRQQTKHALIYFRNHSGVARDIPHDIHLSFVESLFQTFPDLPVQTFYGNETFQEAQAMFGNAKIVIGPHGAGMVNIVFCQAGTPVLEFINPALIDRPWQMYGGHSFGFPWWPVLLDSYDARAQILKAVHIVEAALEASEQ